MGMERAGVTFASLMSLGPDTAAAHRVAGRGARLRLVLDGRDHRAGGLLAAGRGRAPPPPRSASAPACWRSSCARRWSSPWPAPRCRPSTPTATSCSASASRRRWSPRGGTACPTATGRSPSTREYVTLLRGLPHRREGRLRRRLLRGEGLPARRAARRAPAEDRHRRAQPEDAARWPARWPTASPSTTCRPPTCRGRSSRCARAAPAEIYAYVHAGVCEREEGIELARRDLFSYAVVDAYARSFERAGFGDEVAEIRARHAEGDRDGALAAVSRPHGRRHRRDGRRRHGRRPRCRPTSTPASTSRCSCRCRGAPTGGRRPTSPSAPRSGRA